MTSFTIDKMLKDLPPNPSQDEMDNLNHIAKQYGYTIDWNNRFSYSTEVRCGWREDMMKRRGRNRGCY